MLFYEWIKKFILLTPDNKANPINFLDLLLQLLIFVCRIHKSMFVYYVVSADSLTFMAVFLDLFRVRIEFNKSSSFIFNDVDFF